MSRGMTIAELVQQVMYAEYKVLLDVDESLENSFHSKSARFREIVTEANMVLQELQKDADWNWLRRTWDMGLAKNYRDVAPQAIKIPDDVYKVCTGYGDCVTIRGAHAWSHFCHEIPWTSPRMSRKKIVRMHDSMGAINQVDHSNRAYVEGDFVMFTRPWTRCEQGGRLETSVVMRMEPLHVCTSACDDHCELAYENKVLTDIPDPYYVVVRTAAKRAEGDPSISDRVQSLTDEAAKLLSAMRENDSAHTTPDHYDTSELGYIEVL